MSRRNEDMMIRGERRIEMGSDRYPIYDREDQSMRSWRNLSPSTLDHTQGSIEGRGRRSISIEKRDYDWRLGSGRDSRVRSRSPPYQEARRREIFYEESMRRNGSSPPLEFRRRYELDGENLYPCSRDVRGYDHITSNINEGKDFDGSRFSASSRPSMLAQKSMILEDSSIGGVSGLHQDIDPASSYKGTSGYFSSLKGTLGASRIGNESLRYGDPLRSDKLSAIQSSKEGEKPMYYSRDDFYPVVPTSKFSNLGSASSGRSNVSASYLDSRHLSHDDFLRNTAKPSEPLKLDAYSPEPLFDSTRNLDMDPRDLAYHQQEAFSPKIQHQDHLYPRGERREYDDYRYPSNEIYRNISPPAQREYHQVDMTSRPRMEHDDRDTFPHARVDYHQRDLPLHARSNYHRREMPPRTRLDYEKRDMPSSSRLDHYKKDSSATGIIESIDSIDNDMESSRGYVSKSSFRNYPSLQNPTISEGPDMSRTYYSSKEGDEHLVYESGHLEVGRKMSQDLKMDHHMLYLQPEYIHERGGRGSESQRGRLEVPFESECDEEMDRHALRSQRWEAEDLSIEHVPSRMFKRNYSVEEEASRYGFRSSMSHQQYMNSGPPDFDDSRELWLDEDMDGLPFAETRDSSHHRHRKPDRMFHGQGFHRYISRNKFLANRGPFEHAQRNFSKFHKPSHRHIKGHARPGPLSLSKRYQFNKRSEFRRHSSVWKRINDEKHLEENSEDVNTLENCDISSNPEPLGDTDEFKQLVHKAFLKFSKKLNETSAVRRRYMEQGEAGTLCCVVCNKSLPKGFKNTQRLAMHAFMSRKTGYSAQHLGLLKAICVMMGWNNDVDQEALTWTPEVLTQSVALAQREDLMLWPPVLIIHNITISSNNPDNRKVVTAEELEVFLRGKGFMKGKIDICLGKPANHSIMVVKFLGTFLGLQDMERLNNYFAVNKHGRLDLERKASKNRNSVEAELPEENVNEQVLFGYMGTAEDLDKLDFETKRKSLIQSKKAIQDFADDPVKPGGV